MITGRDCSLFHRVQRNPDSSVSIVTKLRSSRNLSLRQCAAQTDSEAHPASYPMGIARVKQLGRETEHSPSTSAKAKNALKWESAAIPPFSHTSSWRGAWSSTWTTSCFTTTSKSIHNGYRGALFSS
jgi:hypothetical protein